MTDTERNQLVRDISAAVLATCSCDTVNYRVGDDPTCHVHHHAEIVERFVVPEPDPIYVAIAEAGRKSGRRNALRGEIATLERFLAQTPEEDVIDRNSLMGRIEAVKEQLAEIGN
jgi:hypothetical protein